MPIDGSDKGHYLVIEECELIKVSNTTVAITICLLKISVTQIFTR